MPRLTYDFDDDIVGLPPAGWAYNSHTGSSYSFVVNRSASNNYLVVDGSVGGILIADNTDATSNLGDVIFGGTFYRSGAGTSFYLRLRGNGGSFSSYSGYHVTVGNNVLTLYSVAAGSYSQLATTAATTTAGVKYSFKFECSGTTIRFKLWASAGSEPGTWNLDELDSSYSSGGVQVGGSRATICDPTLWVESDEINTPTNVTPNAGTAEIAGYGPYVFSQGIVVRSGTGNINYNKDRQHTVKVSVNVTQSPLGEGDIAGYDPVVGFPINVAPVGNMNIAGYNPTVAASASKVRLFFKFKDENGFVWTREIDGHPPVVEVSSTYIASSTEETILADASGGAFTITMPTVTGRNGYVYTIKKTDSSVNAVTVAGTIDGDTNFDLEFQDESITITANASGWWII